jgi:hypothetical protein
MKKSHFFLIFFAMLLTVSLNAQSSITISKITDNNPEIFPIDGSHILESMNKEVYKYFSENPDALIKSKLSKVSDWGFTVGSRKSFYAVNFTTEERYASDFTCRAVGNNCYIFVQDAVWSTRVNQAGVDSVLKAFDQSTPANPTLGIYNMDVNAFGNPPDVDNDPRIVILILDILDGFSGTGGFIAGYFDSYNEVLEYANSNKGEFYYIDANPLNLTTTGGVQTAMSTAAHEFQHMINFNYHQSSPQTTFINESCSMLAELYCGYPSTMQYLYANEPNYYLLGWRSGDNTQVLNDYSRAQKFSLYLWDQFGIGIFKHIVQSAPLNGTAVYDYALQQISAGKNFNDVFIDWLVANYLNDISTNRSYGYLYPNITKTNSSQQFNPNVSINKLLDNLSADYYTYLSGTNLNVTVSANSSVIVKAIQIGDGVHQVTDVPLNTQTGFPQFGTTYSSVTLVIINTGAVQDQNYSLVSSGDVNNFVQEMKWDTSEPTGYFNWSKNDTIAVDFDAFPGGKLDSIRVALRRAGSISGGVWEFTGLVRPTPLGKKLASITASIGTETTLPYPVPYKNWATINLTSQSISTDKDFAVGFVIGANPSAPGVMVTDYTPSSGAYHSYTYLQTSDGVTTPNWYYIGGNDTVSIYLIRAYVSFVTTDGEKSVVELLPKSYSVSQNYPNPFNPSTNFRYSIPQADNVKVTIYNVTGEMVAEVINQFQSAGTYEVNWDGKNSLGQQLASGTYIYRVQAGDFVSSRKMILLK